MLFGCRFGIKLEIFVAQRWRKAYFFRYSEEEEMFVFNIQKRRKASNFQLLRRGEKAYNFQALKNGERLRCFCAERCRKA